MSNNPMLKFTDINLETPVKRISEGRVDDFNEIYKEYASDKAEDQASRCSQCGVPYCQSHCPLHNNIPDWLKLTTQGRLKEAYTLSQKTNSFPEICGRICPQDRLCEGNCVIEQSGHGTVTIGSIEKYITDTAWKNGWVKPITPKIERDETVAIIGAGPGGLAAAATLRKNGLKVNIYDRYDRAGGLMTYGIPSFKLEKDVVSKRVTQLNDSGVNFHLNCNVGKDISFEQIISEHHATIIATGVYKSRELDGLKIDFENIVEAIDFLTASNRKGFGDPVKDFDNGKLNSHGKKVVVIGGGDTAMDCVRTAIRQGAASVKCLYRRDRGNMPGSQREVLNAEEEGVEFVWLSAPKSFVGKKIVKSVKVSKMRLGPADSTGRQFPEEIKGSAYFEDADLVIKALGFDPEDIKSFWHNPRLEFTRWGTIKTDFRTHSTNLKNVYAIGDISRGASLVVWAIKDGQEVAENIINNLKETVNMAAE